MSWFWIILVVPPSIIPINLRLGGTQARPHLDSSGPLATKLRWNLWQVHSTAEFIHCMIMEGYKCDYWTNMGWKHHFCKTIIPAEIQQKAQSSRANSLVTIRSQGTYQHQIEEPQKPVITTRSFKVQIMFHQWHGRCPRSTGSAVPKMCVQARQSSLSARLRSSNSSWAFQHVTESDARLDPRMWWRR
jgi:hypothetical protein